MSGLLARLIGPLALMPVARLRSLPLARTRSAWVDRVFLFRRFQPALCISSICPFPTSSAPQGRNHFRLQACVCKLRPSTSWPRRSGRSCSPGRQQQPWVSCAIATARAKDTSCCCAARSAQLPWPPRQAVREDSHSPPWLYSRAAPCRRSSFVSVSVRSRQIDFARCRR